MFENIFEFSLFVMFAFIWKLKFKNCLKILEMEYKTYLFSKKKFEIVLLKHKNFKK